MTASPKFASLAFCLFNLIITSHLWSQKLEDDARYLALVKELKAAQSDINSAAEKRKSKYINDLKGIEKTVAAATGDLELVLQVTNERKSWEAGNPTPSMDPKDNSIPLELRKLRYYFDQELTKVIADYTDQKQAANAKMVKQIEALVKTLTTEEKIADAIKLREMKNQFISGTLAFEADNNEPKNIIPSNTPETKTEHPKIASTEITKPKKEPNIQSSPISNPANGFFGINISDPKNKPLDVSKSRPARKTGRIVYIPLSDEGLPTNLTGCLNQIEESNYSDIVSFKIGAYSSIVALRDNGQPLRFQNGATAIPESKNAIEVFSKLGGNEFVWLNKDGSIGSTHPNKLNRLKAVKVPKLKIFRSSAFAIDQKDKRHLICNLNGSSFFSDIINIDEVEDAIAVSRNNITVLFKDGSLVQYIYQKNEIKKDQIFSPGECQKLFTYFNPSTFAGLRTDNTVFVNGYKSLQTVLNKTLTQQEKDPIVVFRLIKKSPAIVKTRSGQWYVFTNEAGEYKRNLGWETVVDGAIDIHLDAFGVALLLPSDSVSRSGIWKFDKLQDYRK